MLLNLWRSQEGKCLVCGQAISKRTGWHVHHILEKAKGGNDDAFNLVILHPNCHMQVHNRNLIVVKPIPTKQARDSKRLESICDESRSDGS